MSSCPSPDALPSGSKFYAMTRGQQCLGYICATAYVFGSVYLDLGLWDLVPERNKNSASRSEPKREGEVGGQVSSRGRVKGKAQKLSYRKNVCCGWGGRSSFHRNSSFGKNGAQKTDGIHISAGCRPLAWQVTSVSF